MAVICPKCKSDETIAAADRWQCLACRVLFKEAR